ncbi:MAG: 50S ribosomal protein L9 [Campylobacteraceae bacterium]|jgi:large subunit ribosomal protein L9|nr:50S ribosomal protein L9 [Campylobacteraceae bacterium]MBT3881949.1 50S ribosomal protein L9 [Campylobacteraceae bacterium]MBT4031205.1 50S ribosomal protein L9 [Campylobacteraceae bacterium]MBT4572896.1 50S ribosomal protein L9 [Campylobacteraceae bacterium]MBT4708489.1 50S ribosomal protein L9 [Campylobacteraceae bacterium]
MKVLLIKDVKALGKAGEIKEVKPGYGQNFLIGKGFAKNATPEVIEQWKVDQENMRLALEKELKDANDFKEIIEASKFTVAHKVGANGHLIGSVTNKEIGLTLEKAGIVIDKKQISLNSKIKMPGIYEADCKLGHGVHATAVIDVIEAK